MLEALDPEQRQVAEALRGPVRVLAGAGTGKTRAITHRIAHGVATGVYAPTEVLALSFTTRAAGEMRERLRSLGAPGVQARTFHSAALRQLRFFWPRVHNRDLPELTESKLGMLALAARRQRLGVDQATLRDLASEIEWAKVSNVGPDTYVALARARGRAVSGLGPRGGRARLRRLRGGQARSGPDGHGGRPPLRGRACSPTTRPSPPRSAASTSGSSSTSSRTSRRSSRRCSTSGSAAATSSASSATPPRRSTPSPAPTRATSASSPSVPLRHERRAGPQLPLHSRGHRRCQPAPRRHRQQGRRPRRPAPVGARITYREAADEVAEADAVADRVAALRAQGTPASRMAVLLRINAQSERFEEALAARSIPYVVRGAERFFDRREVRAGDHPRPRCGPQRRGRPGRSPTSVVAVLSQMGHSTEPPEGRGEVRNRWESLQALVDLAADFGREQPERRARRPRRRPRPPRQRAARAGRRRGHRGDHPLRQGPRVGRRLRGRHAREDDADLAGADRRPRSRRSAACSTSR